MTAVKLLSEKYRQQQQALHTATAYGTASIAEAKKVADIINANGIKTVLDYGAGRGNLIKTLHRDKLVTSPFSYRPYEPCNPAYPEWATEPADDEQYDLVTCIDVLEHIEPECLDAVLDDLADHAGFLCYVTVHTGPAGKTLGDGRNAHLIQQPAAWWLPQLMRRLDLAFFSARPHGFVALLNKPQD